ncbi:TRAP-type mannitol/chloroaromatic compound transport system, small permease component [Pseudooceanicola antarcticus]|uniref:TRAP transporter small permease protein n=1 Tax=Pseudooceanicola antarcticus TaxID=1247613 RepID=A0A285IL21_9RHOB|nr:TRAP transporter small permease [Pseudooceanicola antarcticus]PJE28650.1 TRAP transporter small permease [Pseudooceanicola antarcticus]SNY48644.1 TRAP-type mannitol/chloroaromatic compound transport system, small permease component [Pseudooceanicola antarcticus]
MIRRLLDTLYLAGGAVAALAILAICLLVAAQVGLNILARVGGPAWSYTIPSYADFAGFFLAAASFMALAHTLRSGVHIRVNLLISRLNPRATWGLELLTLALATALSAYATRYAISLTHESWDYGDMSSGIVAVPLWIPQLFMDAGLVLLTLAFLDTLVESLRARRPVIADAGEA